MPKKKYLKKQELYFEESPKSRLHKPQCPVLSFLHPLKTNPIPAELSDKSWVKIQFSENLSPLKPKRRTRKTLLNDDKNKNETAVNIETKVKNHYKSLLFEGKKNEFLKSIFEDDDDDEYEEPNKINKKKDVAIKKYSKEKDNRNNYSKVTINDAGQNTTTNEESSTNKITSYFKAKKSTVREKKNNDISSTTPSQSPSYNLSNITSEISSTSDQLASHKSTTSSPLINYETLILNTSQESSSHLTSSNSHPTKPPSISRNPLKITPYDESCDLSDASALSFNNKFFRNTPKNVHINRNKSISMKPKRGMFDIPDTPTNGYIGNVLVPDTPEIHYGKSVKCLQLMKCSGLIGTRLLEV